MKRILILLLFVIPVYAFSMTLPQLFQSAQASNTTFAIANLNLKQASMTYQMNMIQASTPIVNQSSQLSAQIVYTSGMETYQSDLKSYYSNVVSAAFGVEMASINVEIAKMNLTVATMNYASTLALFQKSMASTVSLQQATVTVATDQNNLRNANWNYNFDLSNFQTVTGLNWQGITFTVPVLSTLPSSQTTWVNNDLNFALSNLNLENAQYNLQTTPSNSSRYTMETAKMNVQQAQLNRSNALLSSQNNYSSSIQKLEYDYNNVLNAKANLEISQSNLAFYTSEYNAGLISTVNYLSQYELPYLNTKLSYYTALNTYWSDLVSYMISMGLKPEVALR
jgi:outer membrane protein TolC